MKNRRVHTYDKYAEYGTVTVLHIPSGFTYFLSYFWTYSEHYIIYFMSYSIAFAKYGPITILHIFFHVFGHILHIFLHNILPILHIYYISRFLFCIFSMFCDIMYINFHILHIMQCIRSKAGLHSFNGFAQRTWDMRGPGHDQRGRAGAEHLARQLLQLPLPPARPLAAATGGAGPPATEKARRRAAQASPGVQGRARGVPCLSVQPKIRLIESGTLGLT